LSSSEHTEAALTRWRLDLAYDGSSFHGFAEQPGQETVVGVLRAQLARMLRLDPAPSIVGAGRTDAGVHALAQVVHVDLPSPLFPDERGDEAARLIRSLNRVLARRVVVARAAPVERTFHARFSATWRRYRYLVVEDAAPLEFLARIAWGVEGPLDLRAMNEACESLLGEHDFGSFCRRPATAAPGVPQRRLVTEAHWREVEDPWVLAPGRPRVLRFDVQANSFCHQMVRSLTSTLVGIGAGTLDPAVLTSRLREPRREGLPSPAPAAGLALVAVGYGRVARDPSGFVS